MNFHLHLVASASDAQRLTVTGRNAGTIQDLSDNLVLATLREVLQSAGKPLPTLSLHVHNEIPLGMGCGSSAAALVAGVALANHFGELQWDARQVLEEASRREGHPDNVAACVLGGFTASAMRDGKVDAVSFQPPRPWQLLLVLPQEGLATRTARGLLPDTYSRADAVVNVQNAALLTAAFQTGDEHLLRSAMADRLHQPYRAAVCPLLGQLLPLAGQRGILGVALSGAGPSVLLVVRSTAEREPVQSLVRASVASAQGEPELLWTQIAGPALLG